MLTVVRITLLANMDYIEKGVVSALGCHGPHQVYRALPKSVRDCTECIVLVHTKHLHLAVKKKNGNSQYQQPPVFTPVQEVRLQKKTKVRWLEQTSLYGTR